MNKREKEQLIQALLDIGGCGAEEAWAQGYDDGINSAVDLIEEIVPTEVAFSRKNATEIKEEPLFYVEFTKKFRLYQDIQTGFLGIGYLPIDVGYRIAFTESEIKNFDSRYWPFAVAVSKTNENI